ncbi:hypothetical protein J6I44_10350 [Aliifodinibius sp. 1BSP15-2V2]|uniref:YD repeat-containing protein n=2 Tax=Fodinibius salsisoli TaxID=2820877 RepID=A0ABT3PNG0_9BACT|nr:hypothetical protein [Fodinibius salsisoli]
MSNLVELSQKVERTKKLNQILIHDLFVSYELTEKHWNLKALLNYAPQIYQGQAERIEVTSHIAGQDELVAYRFDETGSLSQIMYQVDRGGGELSRYYYDFYYEYGQLSHVNIAGEKKIEFSYDQENRLKTITRDKNGTLFEYNFEYLADQNRADIKLFVIKNGNRKASTRAYFVEWNEALKLRAFYLDVYQTHQIFYSERGTPTSFQFDATKATDVDLSWKYRYDEHGNWIEKTYRDNWYKRNIFYRD